jgi:hypothetical protein
MKQKLPAFAVLLMATLALWAACTKPTPFGSNLLEEEQADYDFTDTVTVWCTIELEDSLLTSDQGSTAGSFLCGELNDPLFGKSTAEIFSLLQLDFPDPGFDTTKQQFDSIVLFLRYAPANVYGDTMQTQNLRVFRLEEALDDESEYYSTSKLQEATELGRIDGFFPKPNTADSLIVTNTKAPYIRVPLSNDFGNELFNLDSITLSDDSTFYRAVRGLKIVSSSGTTPGAMLAFNLNDESYSRVRLYYHTKADTAKTVKAFDFFFAGANKFVHFEHDYNGSPAGQQIGLRSDEFIYMQGMQGVRVKVEFPYIDRFEDIAVNKAQLVLTRATNAPGENATLTPASQLVLTELRSDTSLFVFTSDVSYSLGPALNQGFGRFGGNPEKENINGTFVERYRLTLTQRLQDMVDDTSSDLKKKTVYINVSPQSRVAQRSIVYGPKNATFPLKLELKYTRVR